MNCPNCQTLCRETDHFCYLCGTPLLQELPKKPKKGSRWVPLLLLILMSVGGIFAFFATVDTAPMQAPAIASGDCFILENGVLYFNKALYDGSELTVPSQINGKPVTSIGRYCFANCTELTSIILPDSLTSISEGAFSGCTALRAMDIPDHVTTIGKKAFYGCSALEAVQIPSSMNSIGEDAFDNCSYLGYIFYDGIHSSWSSLYDEFINPYVGVICEDGSFYQGGELYD